MRPARKGPETCLARAGLPAGPAGFNEAGPQGAGNVFGWRAPGGDAIRFNEAGPQGAGNVDLLDEYNRQVAASMRPARKGPETIGAQIGGSLFQGLLQ